jgi:hypothetical protein
VAGSGAGKEAEAQRRRCAGAAERRRENTENGYRNVVAATGAHRHARHGRRYNSDRVCPRRTFPSRAPPSTTTLHTDDGSINPAARV